MTKPPKTKYSDLKPLAGFLNEESRRALAAADCDPLVAQVLYDLQPKDIGWALERLRKGRMVRRRAWPQGMRLQTDVSSMHVILRTPTGPEVPWVCSLEDLRSEDWQ